MEVREENFHISHTAEKSIPGFTC